MGVAAIERETGPGPALVLVAPDMSEGVLDYYLDQTPRLRLEPWRPDEPVDAADARSIWVVVTRLLDPDRVTESLPEGWDEADRRLFRKDTGIWLIRFERASPEP